MYSDSQAIRRKDLVGLVHCLVFIKMTKNVTTFKEERLHFWPQTSLYVCLPFWEYIKFYCSGMKWYCENKCLIFMYAHSIRIGLHVIDSKWPLRIHRNRFRILFTGTYPKFLQMLYDKNFYEKIPALKFKFIKIIKSITLIKTYIFLNNYNI